VLAFVDDIENAFHVFLWQLFNVEPQFLFLGHGDEGIGVGAFAVLAFLFLFFGGRLGGVDVGGYFGLAVSPLEGFCGFCDGPAIVGLEFGGDPGDFKV